MLAMLAPRPLSAAFGGTLMRDYVTKTGFRHAVIGLSGGIDSALVAAIENLQARIRGNYLMALSNKFGWLVLTTANKSEMAVGYSTLYGDMAGGFAVIKDVPKMLVYELAEHANVRAGRELIPRSIFDRAPSAELRPGQTDQDSLPPYPELDAILEAYVEGDQGKADIVARGFAEATVKRVIAMVDKNEYKRRQGPIGIKITPRAFGKDWRLPIVNRFQE
jgi:NAD+ synthase (glutamine-hydrolysing)